MLTCITSPHIGPWRFDACHGTCEFSLRGNLKIRWIEDGVHFPVCFIFRSHEAGTPKFTVAEQRAILQKMQSTLFTNSGSVSEHGNGLHRLNITTRINKAAEYKDKQALRSKPYARGKTVHSYGSQRCQHRFPQFVSLFAVHYCFKGRIANLNMAWRASVITPSVIKQQAFNPRLSQRRFGSTSRDRRQQTSMHTCTDRLTERQREKTKRRESRV